MAYHSPAPSRIPFTTNYSTPGRNAHIFQPPQSPASSVTTPAHATAPDYFSTASHKRSRSRPDPPRPARPSHAATPSWVQCPTPGDGSYASAGGNSGYGRNSLLVNERYRLAGGLDTPGLQATAEMEQLQLASHGEERTWRGEASSHAQEAVGTPLAGPLMRERNGVARMPSFGNGTGDASKTWTGLAFDLVGKVFQLSTTVFRGFYAGGGEGYDFKHSPLQSMWRGPPDGCSTPLPGSWCQDEFLGDFEQDSVMEQTVSWPGNKRRQTSAETWVMVGTPDIDGIAASPRHKGSNVDIATFGSPAASRPSASRASSRRSLLPLPRRQSHQPTHQQTTTHVPSSPSQLPVPSSPARRASLAPMRRPSTSSSNHNPMNAYISPEAEKFVKRRAKNEKQADAAMSDLSRKLAELIRQGQEALGTRVEVEGEGDGGEGEEVWA
ncbi:hypothetical protein LTR08_004826 [Meristemomyces frigidus]|nr:hypothetical protein LTR08_004826 [Meristemomyces frigidus]